MFTKYAISKQARTKERKRRKLRKINVYKVCFM